MKKNMILSVLTFLVGTLQLVAQSFSWVNQQGGIDVDVTRDVVVDQNGNSYVTGFYENQVDFDPSPSVATLMSNGEEDVFIAKYDSSGNFVWVRGFGGISFDRANSITLDNSGNLYVVGFFNATVDFDWGVSVDSSVSMGADDIFIVQCDTNGNFLWKKTIGGIGDDSANDVKVNGTGDIIVAGYFEDMIDLDANLTIDTVQSNGAKDIFIIKYTALGAYVWGNSYGDTGFDNINSIAIDNQNNIFVTGRFFGSVDFDPGVAINTLNSLGAKDILIAKYDDNGDYVWAKNIGGTISNEGRGIAVDPNGNCFVTGDYFGTIDFDPSSTAVAMLTSNGSSDAFIAKYDLNGNYLWAEGFGGNATDIGYALTLNNNNQVYLTGTFLNTVDFDPSAGTNNATSIGSTDIFISKFDSNGTYLISRTIGGLGLDLCYAIEVGINENLFLTGYFQGTSDFDFSGVFNLTSNGQSDGFIAKYSFPILPIGVEEDYWVTTDISIFPNPASDFLTIDFKRLPVKTIHLISAKGKLIKSFFLESKIDVSYLSSGLYFIQLIGDENTTMKKFIKY